MKKNEILFSFIWKFLERSGTYFAQFIIQVILARLLLPEEYGIIAIVTVFITISNVFVQTGFNTALIQKKEVDDVDYSSTLYASLLIALVIYLIIYFSAPYVANFYQTALISPVLRILGLTLFVGAFNSIQNAVIARSLLFKKNFISSSISILISGIIGIIAAYCDFGVWSLVIYQILSLTLMTIILLFIINWRPKLIFSFKRIKTLFSYGWKLLCSSLIDNLYIHVYDLVIGKKYTTTDLAFYNRGKQFPYLIVCNINGAISTVLLPAMSREQEKPEIVKSMTRKSITISSFIMFPMMFGLAVVAKPLISLILTDKWLECAPFLQMLCFSYILWPIHTANLQAINAMGRSDIFLKLEIIKKIVGLFILIITIPMGLYAMTIGQIISSILSSFINAYPNKKILNYSYLEQMKDLLPTILISIIMGSIVYAISYLPFGNLIVLLTQCIMGIIIYVSLAYIFKISALEYVINVLKKLKRKEC